MVLNIHYLCLSVRWEVPWGDFNKDEVVMFFFLSHLNVIRTAALPLTQTNSINKAGLSYTKQVCLLLSLFICVAVSIQPTIYMSV